MIGLNERSHNTPRSFKGDGYNPMGVSEYPLTQALPDELQGNLPSIALLEQSGAEHE